MTPRKRPRPNGSNFSPQSAHRDNEASRLILHLDVDAFYVACERELRPDLIGKPLAVSQYNPYGDLQDVAINDPKRLVITPGDKDSGRGNNNGSLIAVSYEARSQNVKRNDRGLEAKRKCPGLYVMQVPMKHGKADLTLYRRASQRVVQRLSDGIKEAGKTIYEGIFQPFLAPTAETKPDAHQPPKELSRIVVEKASVDEVYVDITLPVQALVQILETRLPPQFRDSALAQLTQGAEETTVGGLETNASALANNSLSKADIRRGSSLQVLDNKMDASSLAWWRRSSFDEWTSEELRLAVGAALAARARKSVQSAFGVYTLSAGIACNKTLAKLASGLKKPNRQTLIDGQNLHALQKLFYPLPLGRIRGLGGKMGDNIAKVLQVQTVGELARIPSSEIQKKFPDHADWLYRISQGICDEPVEDRTKVKSIEASKTFRNHLTLFLHGAGFRESINKWMAELASEVDERLAFDYEDHHRHASILSVSLMLTGTQRKSISSAITVSKSTPLSYGSGVKEDHGRMAFGLAMDLLSSNDFQKDDQSAVICIAVSASNFVPVARGSQSIAVSFQRLVDASKNQSTAPKHTMPKAEMHSPPKDSSSKSSLLDPDMEYAKRLQEDFDRENKLWSQLERRRPRVSGNSQIPSKKSKIQSFFHPRSKDKN